MNFLGIASVSAIVIICYLIGMTVKASGLENKWIPIICGVCGAGLGMIGMICMPDFPAGDYITAIAVGIVSGLASTGCDQAVKQFIKNKYDVSENMRLTIKCQALK